MLSIAFDAKRLFLNHTGLGNYSRTLVQNLAQFQDDVELHLFTPKTAGSFAHFTASPYHVHTAQSSIFSGYWRSFGLKSVLRQIKPQVFHGLSHELPIGLGNTGIKQVVSMHDLIYRYYPNDFGWFDRNIYALKWRHSIRHADKIVAISEHTAQDVKEQFHVAPDRVEVVYQACSSPYYAARPLDVELNQFKAQYRLPQDYLLSVGSLVPRKNLLRTVQAFSMLPSDQRPLLVIVGAGKKYKEMIIKEIIRLGLVLYILWWPNAQVDTPTLRLLYSGALATVFPSLYEGFGLPVVESLLCHTPVITSSITSLPEAAGPGALYIDPHQIESISDAMLSVVNDREICRRLAKNGFQYVHEKFSPERTAAQLRAVYDSVL